MLEYLYHFDTSADSQEKLKLNPTNTIVVPVLTSYVHITEMLAIILSPECLLNDSSCNWGATGNQKFNACVGRCPNGHILTFLRAFMAETKANFLFIFQFALYIVYGDVMKLVVNVVMDGNPHVHNAAKQALESGFFGTRGLTIVRTCFFHAVTQKNFKEYLSQLAGISLSVFNTDGFQKAISETSSTDGGIGLLVYYWIKWIVYEVKTQEQCLESLEQLHKFIDGQTFSEHYTFAYPDRKVYTKKHKVALAKFVREISGNLPLMANAYTASFPVDFGLFCTSMIEGDFGVRKRESNINSKSKVTAVLEYESHLVDRRDVTKTVTSYRDTHAVPTNLGSNENGSVLRLLTPLARDKLQCEIDASFDWSVTRIAEYLFVLQLTKKAAKKIRRGLQIQKCPHLINWIPDHEKCVIMVKEDSKGGLRLRCGCLTCKSNFPCRRLIAIKGGRVDTADVHIRYHCDFLNGTYPFITRVVEDLTAFQGAIFSLADNAKHMIVVVPSAISSNTSTLDDVSMSCEVNTVVFFNLSISFLLSG